MVIALSWPPEEALVSKQKLALKGARIDCICQNLLYSDTAHDAGNDKRCERCDFAYEEMHFGSRSQMLVVDCIRNEAKTNARMNVHFISVEL